MIDLTKKEAERLFNKNFPKFNDLVERLTHDFSFCAKEMIRDRESAESLRAEILSTHVTFILRLTPIFCVMAELCSLATDANTDSSLDFTLTRIGEEASILLSKAQKSDE